MTVHPPALHPAVRITRAAAGLSYARPLMETVPRWLRDRSPATLDALLAGGLAILTVALTPAVAVHHGYRHADALALVLAALASLVLVFRRRRPLGTLLASLGVMLVFVARGYEGGPALLAPLVALYTLATLESRSRSLAAGVLIGLSLSAARLIFTSEPAGTAATDALGYIGAALFLGWAVANRRAFVAAIRDRAERAEHSREQEAQRRVDAERLRIARELHDVVAHSIQTINVQAGVAEHVIERQPGQAGKALSIIRQTSKQALGELREILGLLRQVDEQQPRRPTAGLDQLDALLSATREAGVQTELQIGGERRNLPTAVDLAAYRIVQEALTNVMRHAGAARTRVSIDYRPDELHVTICDEGTGHADIAFDDGSGHGILGMRERANALGGTLAARHVQGGGFEVSVSLPLTTPPLP
jgi:signal transduction histidine kinase